jgi:hypothetical protein
MTHPGQPGQPFPPQGEPGPYGAPGPYGPPQGQSVPPQGRPGAFGAPGPYGPPAPAPRSGRGKAIAGVVGAVAIGGAVAAAGLLGLGSPEVGDCIEAEGDTSFSTVDCDESAATARIVGVIEEQVTEDEFFQDSYQPCGAFPTTTQILWDGETGGEGTVYCAEDA